MKSSFETRDEEEEGEKMKEIKEREKREVEKNGGQEGERERTGKRRRGYFSNIKINSHSHASLISHFYVNHIHVYVILAYRMCY